MTVTFVDPFVEHPAAVVTVTVSCTGPVAAASNAIAAVPVPPVIVPFVIPQVYVAPAPASGTLAACPVVLAQTAEGAVMAAEGTGFTVTFVDPFAEQPAAVATVTVSCTGPVAAASNVIDAVPVPPVIVPFVIPHVYVAPAPASGTLAACPVVLAQTAEGAVIVAEGTGFTVTFADSLAEQPAAVATVTVSCTGPVAAASNVIDAVPVPPVIVPFVIPHVYVAPAPASGTLAACPVVLAQTAAGAVIVAEGTGFTVTFADPLAEQPAAVATVTVSCTGPVAAASKVIDAVPVPPVIVPFVIPHVYVAPAPASGTLAACPVVLAQTAAGAVIVADGTGLIGTSIEVDAVQLEALVTVSVSVTLPEAPAV